MKSALAFDVGGTKIYSAIINNNGEIVSDIEKHQTPKDFAQIKALFDNIIKKNEECVDIVAFSTCGAVNNSNDRIVGSTGNIVKEYPQIVFKELSKKPVFVENDANCAAWAEYRIGASKDYRNSIMLTFGTGVGGGIIVNGKILKGKNGAAGEMHFKMRTDNHRKCTCGGWDCYEIYTSGTGLVLSAKEMLNINEITTYEIIDGANNNNSDMLKILEIWQKDIKDGMIGLCNLFDPDCFVLSGAMAQFIDNEEIERSLNNEILGSYVKVLKAQAGNYSGMIGAALLAFEKGL